MGDSGGRGSRPLTRVRHSVRHGIRPPRRGGPMVSGIWQDVRFGVRMLAKHRQFTLVSVLILAAGAGATTAVFSVVNAVLLRPLPYDDPSRLVAIVSVYKGAETSRRAVVRLTDLAEWRTRSASFAAMGAFAYQQ